MHCCGCFRSELGLLFRIIIPWGISKRAFPLPPSFLASLPALPAAADAAVRGDRDGSQKTTTTTTTKEKKKKKKKKKKLLSSLESKNLPPQIENTTNKMYCKFLVLRNQTQHL
jgi:hypothetical protein